MPRANNGTLLDIQLRNATPGPLTTGARGLTLSGTAPAGTTANTYYWKPTIAGGVGPFKVSVYLGALPAELSVQPADGTLFGKRISPGTYNVVLQVVDSTSQTATLLIRVVIT